MSETNETTDRLRRHLVGASSEAERQDLERAVLEDDELFERLEAAEDELIDQYVRGELDADSARKIASLVESSPRLRAKEETTLALETWQRGRVTPVTSVQRSTEPPDYRRALWGAVIVVAGLLAAWLFVQTARFKAGSAALAARNQALEERIEALEKTVSVLESSNRSLARRLARFEAEDP